MARWEPDARGRLQAAALELYGERGFDETTVAEIAQRAGLTERTFFRHFADKREVLFWGENTLHELLVLAVAGAPESASPIDAFAAGLKPAVAVYFENRPREQSRLRQAVIASNTALQERELIKLSRLAAGVAEALRRRGVAEPGASLAAEAGVAVFRVAAERWTDATDDRDLVQHIDEALAEAVGESVSEVLILPRTRHIRAIREAPRTSHTRRRADARAVRCARIRSAPAPREHHHEHHSPFGQNRHRG